MLLDLSETYSESLNLVSSGQVSCEFSLSQSVLSRFPEESREVFQAIGQQFPRMWERLVQEIPDNPWIQQLSQSEQRLCFSVLVVDNAEIQAVNREYRQKDKPTDVLTFSLLEDGEMAVDVSQWPELDLGEIYLSLEWAIEAVCNESNEKLNFFHVRTLYIMERLVHGCLHLLGVHHDTIPDYNKVVAIQRTVLDVISS